MSVERKKRRKVCFRGFLVYSRTSTIKQIGGHNGFVKLNGFVLCPCHPVVIHFLLDKDQDPTGQGQ